LASGYLKQLCVGIKSRLLVEVLPPWGPVGVVNNGRHLGALR